MSLRVAIGGVKGRHASDSGTTINVARTSMASTKRNKIYKVTGAKGQGEVGVILVAADRIRRSPPATYGTSLTDGAISRVARSV